MVKIKSRYYYSSELCVNSILNIENSYIIHHFSKILRGKENEYISLFNPINGEFVSQVVLISKKFIQVKVINQIKPAYTNKYPVLHLAYSPLKKEATDFIIEKSTELQINKITPIITNRTVNKPLNQEKMHLKILPAVEQCERIDFPTLNPSTNLKDFIKENNDKIILWLNESLEGVSLTNFYKNQQNSEDTSVEYIILVGPEGGFTNEEKTLLNSLPNVVSTYINTNILKAETAAITAIVVSNLFIKEL